MGRAEKYANIMDKYEKGIAKLEELEKKEESLSITRELKFDELQKKIDNSVTIADYEELEYMEKNPGKKPISDTKEIQVEDVPMEDTSEIEVKKEVEVPKKANVKDKKVDTGTFIFEDLVNDVTEDEEDDDDLFLTKSMNPIRKKKTRLKRFAKVLLIILLLAIIGVLAYFKVFKPLYSNISNADPQKVFENGFDYLIEKVDEVYNQYVDGDIVSLNLDAKIDSDIDKLGNDKDVKYGLKYAYDAKNKKMFSDVSVHKGETFNNQFILDDKLVYEKLSSYDNYIKLEPIDNIMVNNQYYKDNKVLFDNLEKYILPSEYYNYVKTYLTILKNNFKEEMFSKKNDRIDRDEYKVNVIKNSLTLNEEDLKKIDDEIQNKMKTDSGFKKAYEVLGNLIDTKKKKIVINIYTKLNNNVVGFEIETEGFTSTYGYLLKDDGTIYDLHFNIGKNILDISRRGEKIAGSLTGASITFNLVIKEINETKLSFEYDVLKNNKKYVGSLDITSDKNNKKYIYDLKGKDETNYINAYGELSYKVDKNYFNVDLTKMIDPTVTQLNTFHEEFKKSFSTEDLSQKYDSWYKIVTQPNMLTIK